MSIDMYVCARSQYVYARVHCIHVWCVRVAVRVSVRVCVHGTVCVSVFREGVQIGVRVPRCQWDVALPTLGPDSFTHTSQRMSVTSVRQGRGRNHLQGN